MLKLSSPESITRFRDFLENISLAELVQALRSTFPHPNPWLSYKLVAERLSKLDPQLQSVFRLLLLGDTVSLSTVTSFLKPSLITTLEEIGFITTEDGIRTDGYGIVPYDGYYFVADLPARYPTHRKIRPDAYIDIDTFFLAPLIAGKSRHGVIDVCSGAGVLAILAARSTSTVVATEINPAALNVASFNSILNRVDDRIRFCESDLFEGVEESSAEFICANPPYLALPPGSGHYLAGDGGEEGMQVVFAILQRIDKYLAERGEALIMGGSFGDESLPQCLDRFQQITRELRRDMDVFLLERLNIDLYARGAASNFETSDVLCHRIREYARQNAFTRFYVLLIRIKRRSGAGKLRVFDASISMSQRARDIRRLRSDARTSLKPDSD